MPPYKSHRCYPPPKKEKKKRRKKRVSSRDPPTLSAAEGTLNSLQTSQQTRKAPNLQYSSPRGQRAIAAPGRSETTEEFQHSPALYLEAWNPSSQLLSLACLTAHTEPVLLGLHGETSHTGQRQISKNSSRVGIFSLFWNWSAAAAFLTQKKISFSQKAICLKGSAQLT